MGICGSKPDQPAAGDLALERDLGRERAAARLEAAAAAADRAERGAAPAPTPAVHSDIVNDVVRGGGPTEIISSSEDGTCVLYDWRQAKVVRCVVAAARFLARPPRATLAHIAELRCVHVLVLLLPRAQVRRWEGHKRGVNAAVYGATSGCAFTAGRDLTIRQWSRGEAASVRSFEEGHDLNIAALALSPDERWLCSGARDTSVRLWDVESGAQIAMNKTPRNLVTALRWVPGEFSVLQASEDLRLRLWDVRSGPRKSAGLKATASMMGHSNIPLCCDVSADGLSFLTCHKGFDGTSCELRVWDRRQGTTRQVLRGHQQAVQTCAFIGGGAGRYAVSGGSDKMLQLWDCSGSAGETAAPPSACLATHYFPSAVQAITPLSAPSAAAAAASSGAEGFDLSFDDEPLAPPPTAAAATTEQIAVGCFDGSLHVMEVGTGSVGSLTVLFSNGGESGSGGDVGYSSSAMGDGGGSGGGSSAGSGGGGGGEFSSF